MSVVNNSSLKGGRGLSVVALPNEPKKKEGDFQRRATTQAAKDMVNWLSSVISARVHRMESNHILADAAALDPRFNRMAFMVGRTADEAFQRVSTAVARLAISSGKPIQQPVQEERAGSAAPESVVWSYFHEKVRMVKIHHNFFSKSRMA